MSAITLSDVSLQEHSLTPRVVALKDVQTNEVEIDGNITYVYKFGYMARDLTMRLGIA